MINEKYIITIICGALCIYLFYKTKNLTNRKGLPERTFKCTVVSKRDEIVSINMTNYRNNLIELENDFNGRREFIAIGKFKYFHYEKLKIGTRGTAYVREDVIYKFEEETE